MAEFKKKIMSLTDGIQSKLSPDKATGFKTLSDVDQDESIGGISSRKGISIDNPELGPGDAVTVHSKAGYTSARHYPERGVTQVWDNKRCKIKLFDTGAGYYIGQTVNDKSFILATPYRDDDGNLQFNGDGTQNKQQITQDASRDPFGVCCLQRDTSTFMCMLTNLMRGKNKDNQGIYIYNGKPADNSGYAYTIDNPICVEDLNPSFVVWSGGVGGEFPYNRPINFYLARWVFDDGTESSIPKVTGWVNSNGQVIASDEDGNVIAIGRDANQYATITVGSASTSGFQVGKVKLHIRRRNNEESSLKRVTKIKVYRITIAGYMDGVGDIYGCSLQQIWNARVTFVNGKLNNPFEKIFNKYSWQLIATLEGDQLDNRESGDSVDDNYVLFEDSDRFLRESATANFITGAVNYSVLNEDGFYILRWNASSESVMLGDNDVYVPTPSWLFDYNGRIFAVGDYAYKNTIFFTKDWETDFLTDNSTTLPVPIGDRILTCGTEHGASAYVFSESSTTRITETSTELPYYKVEAVEGMTGIGCVSPKTLIKIFGRLFFLSKQGFVMFDGSSYQVISNDIDDIIKDNISFKYVDANGNEVTDVETQPCFYIPYHADAIYANKERCIYLAIPTDESVYDPTYRVFKYNIRLSKWSEVTLPQFRSFVREQGIAEKARYLGKDGYMRVIGNGTNTDSYSPVVVNASINSIIESHDIDLGTESIVKYLTLVGEGRVNIEIFTRKEVTTPDVTLNDFDLSAEDNDIPLNLPCRFVRIKLTVVQSTTFKLTQEPILTCYTNGKVGRQ